MTVPSVDLREQSTSLGDEVLRVLEADRKSVQRLLGRAVGDFEGCLEAVDGSKIRVGARCATDALQIAMRVRGQSPGDEAITVPHSFIPAAGPIFHTCPRPALVATQPTPLTGDPGRPDSAGMARRA